jgi:head-tail adaptor
MQAGKMRHRITIQTNTPTQDAYGTAIASWSTFNGAARIPAEVEDALPSKAESTTDALRIATRPARLRIRFRPGVTSAMRILIHGASDRTCRIVAGPAELGRREGLEFMIEEYSTQGAGE